MNKQSGFTIYVILGLLVAIGGVSSWGMWERGKRIGAENEASALRSITTAQSQTIDGLSELASSNADTLFEYGERNNEIQQEALRMSAELNQLRATEENNALAAPFERGNSASERKRRILRRFTGSEDNPDPDKAPDPPGASPTGIREPDTANINANS